jgi:nitrite reductase/ring-hydroxylating ferredoxin subunit
MTQTFRLPATEAPAPGSARRVMVDGRTIAVFNRDGTLYAVDAKCTHVGGPLEKGAVSGTAVTCPWHGSKFDLQTGAVQHGPAAAPVKAYRARVEGDHLLIEGD